jgi:flagellum-specific peptidoglycan hydrolase FlgJ
MTPAQIDEQIYLTAIANGFTDISARLIVAQARLESADYTSNVFKNNANMYGMKYIGQSLATRGTLAPINERSAKCRNTGVCVNNDYYAKYNNPQDSASDVIIRLYSKTIKEVTPEQLKNAKTPIEFATLLKQRGYFGVTASQYATGLKSKLKIISVQPVENLPEVTITSEKKNNLIYYIIAAAVAFIIFGKLAKSK